MAGRSEPAIKLGWRIKNNKMDPEQQAVEARNNLSEESEEDPLCMAMDSVILTPKPKRSTMVRPKTVELRRNKRAESSNNR